MTATDIAAATRNLFERLYDALIDQARRERTMALLLIAYTIVWSIYGTIAKGSQDLHFDTGEMFAWSHQVVWSAIIHPPLGAWLMRVWFAVMPVEDWSFYLFSMVVATIGLWIAWRLAGRYLTAEKRAVGLVMLSFLPFYNFHALKYNANSVLTPFWAAATWWFVLSFETRRAGWAALAGLAAAAAMLGKYWSFSLLAGLALAAIIDPRRSAYFRSAAPWLTIAVGAIALAPHLVFVATHGFTTFHYAMTNHATTFLAAPLWSLYFILDILAFMMPAIVLNALVTWPSVAAIKDTLWPADARHRFFVIAFAGPFLLAALIAIPIRAHLSPLWSMSGMTLLPIILLSSPLVTVQRAAAIRLVALAIIFPLLMVAASPGIAVVIHRYRVPDHDANHYRMIAQAVANAWSAQTDAPLRVVGSYLTIVNGINPYFPNPPATYAITSPERTPWVDEERIRREGIAIVCAAPDADCVREMNAYAGRYGGKTEEVTLARRYFGTDDPPVRYLITIIPPQP